MTIYFNKLKDACAFEIPEPMATVEDDVWQVYCECERGKDWDIIDGEFVKLTSEEDIEKRKTADARIRVLKHYLAETDYQAIKYSEGTLSEEEYADMKAQRQAWRDEINELEALL